MAKEPWDPKDRKYEWSIEKEMDQLIERGRMRIYDRLFEGSVENVRLHSDGSADVDVYGKDENDERGHWHFIVRYNSDGEIIEVRNGHKR